MREDSKDLMEDWKRLVKDWKKIGVFRDIQNIRLFNDVMKLVKLLFGLVIKEAVLLVMKIQELGLSRNDEGFENYLNLEVARIVKKIFD
jgi:hypothetical protein